MMCISYTILLKVLLKTKLFFYLDRKLTLQIFCKKSRPQILDSKGF